MTKDKKVRVLQFSTHNEECGIAKYQEQFIAEMIHDEEFETEFFIYSPNKIKKMAKKELKVVLKKLESTLAGFDIIHIQHEYSFFNKTELAQVIKLAKSMQKKVIVTVHTAPDVQYVRPSIQGLGPSSLKLFTRQHLSAKRFQRRYLDPLTRADLVIVHNEVTKRSIMKFGVKEENILTIRIPVPEAKWEKASTEIKNELNYKPGDIIFCTVGFVSENKGVLQAIRALQYLPANYKLAIIGGIHPQGGNEKFLDTATDIVYLLGLKDRVYITGFIKDDDELNAKIQECDICVYPFDSKYYSFVSSASLNNSIANHKPVIAYRTIPFEEVSNEIPFITFAKSPNYYELARAISGIDIKEASKLSQAYADAHSYKKEARRFLEVYKNLVG